MTDIDLTEPMVVQAIFDALPVPVFVKDRSDQWMVVNDKLCAFLGISSSHLIGKTGADVLSSDVAALFRIDTDAAIELGQSLEYHEDWVDPRDGHRHGLLIHKGCFPIGDEQGAIIGMISDVTHSVEAATALEEAYVNLQEYASQFGEVSGQLERAASKIGQAEMVSGVLHNVGNVLNSINVSATCVRNKVKNSKAASLDRAVGVIEEHIDDLGEFITKDERGRLLPQFLRKVVDAIDVERSQLIKEIDTLIESLDHIKQIISVQQSYAKVRGLSQSVSLPDLISDAIRLVAPSLERHGVDLICDFEPIGAVIVDKTRVLQIISNLIKNAKESIKETFKGEGQIHVALKGRDDDVEIAVRDDGVGIRPEHLERIFTHGFTTKSSGHGFGLHSCEQAARDIGGTLTVASAGPNQGATFRLRIPRG